jgi:hypothetical protein
MIQRDETFDCFCLVADVLGFSAMVLALPEDEQEARVISWVELVTSAAGDCGIEKCQLFRDTVFAAASSTPEGLCDLLAFSRRLLNDGIERGFGVRGGIAEGSIAWRSDVVFGRSIIHAHRLEEAQRWLGISATYAFPEFEGLWGFDSVCMYPVPVKKLDVYPRPCVSWEIPSTPQLSRTLKRIAPSVEDKLDNASIEKVKNTEQFARYLDSGAKANWRPDAYNL